MHNIRPKFNLDKLLEKAYNRLRLDKSEIAYLLTLDEAKDVGRLFQTAQAQRTRYFSDRIFLYGFVYFSTWCRNNCAFCYYRKSNSIPRRYRKSNQEILEAAGSLAESGVHLIDLTMGEDPFYFQKPDGLTELINLVKQVKIQTQLPVMISPGVASQQMMEELATVGTDWYACYQETHNEQLFNQLRLHQSYNERCLSKQRALKCGLLVEEGIMTGIGETVDDIAQSIENMSTLGAQQVRVMSFVPQEGSSMSSWSTPDRINELKVIAVLRLLLPDRLIPASLDVDGVEGLQARLEAGANVITSLIPPSMGLAGVAQSTKDINEGSRTVQGVLPILDRMGLKAATSKEYLDWLTLERINLLRQAKVGV